MDASTGLLIYGRGKHMSDIRQMREGDVEAIMGIEVEAFGAWQKQLYGQASPLPKRTHINIQVCRIKDPQGCFVAEVGDSPVGFIFSRTWGKVGWFGSFSVLPKFQGRGIGKQLISASINYLRKAGAQVIGLETMPESPYNLGLYLKMGFQPHLLTFLMTKSLCNSSDEVMLPSWSSVDSGTQELWTTRLRDGWEGIPPGFDYSKEIITTGQFGQGETLVLTEDANMIGMSTICLQSQRQNSGDERAIVHVLTIHPAYTNDELFITLLSASEALARLKGKQILTIPINARHAWATLKLLDLGYQIESTMVRMTLESMDEEPMADELVNCSRWAG
jgi:ribosomal protein S18 acetylase RimI-like enzyme